MLEHSTHPRMLSHKVGIALIGAGGNGSQMLTGLARLDAAIRALEHPGLDVTVFDPDDVSEANLGRQLFAPADVGRNKAQVLVTRTNAWFGRSWSAEPVKFGYGRTTRLLQENNVQVVISCVDSAEARVRIGMEIDTWYSKPLYWMDLGNRAADGQVVLGIPAWHNEHAAYKYRLPTVLELFPELEERPARSTTTTRRAARSRRRSSGRSSSSTRTSSRRRCSCCGTCSAAAAPAGADASSTASRAAQPDPDRPGRVGAHGHATARRRPRGRSSRTPTSSEMELQPRRQLEELHRRGFWRARLSRDHKVSILEREHYEAVCRGAVDPAGRAGAILRRPGARADQEENGVKIPRVYSNDGAGTTSRTSRSATRRPAGRSRSGTGSAASTPARRRCTRRWRRSCSASRRARRATCPASSTSSAACTSRTLTRRRRKEYGRMFDVIAEGLRRFDVARSSRATSSSSSTTTSPTRPPRAARTRRGCRRSSPGACSTRRRTGVR
jgi:PRTRC genetic system ThiF family protein